MTDPATLNRIALDLRGQAQRARHEAARRLAASGLLNRWRAVRQQQEAERFAAWLESYAALLQKQAEQARMAAKPGRLARCARWLARLGS